MEPVKIVVHYADGRIVKGYTQDFLPTSPSFHVRSLLTENDFIEIPVLDLKGVCFVRDLAGDPGYQEKKEFPEGKKPPGRPIEVTFRDGEVIVGSTLDYDPGRPGFFILPADPKSNNLTIFAVSRAVSKIRYL